MSLGDPAAQYVYKPARNTDIARAGRQSAVVAAADARMSVVRIPITRVASTSEQDTGYDLPAKCIVYDVFLDVQTVEATGTTKTVDVGLLAGESGGDADGFLDGVSVASTTGLKRGIPTITTGSNEVFFASTTRGVLLAALTAGTDAAGDVGTYFEKPHIVATAKSVTYTLGANNFAELVADIVIVFVDLSSIS